MASTPAKGEACDPPATTSDSSLVGERGHLRIVIEAARTSAVGDRAGRLESTEARLRGGDYDVDSALLALQLVADAAVSTRLRELLRH